MEQISPCLKKTIWRRLETGSRDLFFRPFTLFPLSMPLRTLPFLRNSAVDASEVAGPGLVETGRQKRSGSEVENLVEPVVQPV